MIQAIFLRNFQGLVLDINYAKFEAIVKRPKSVFKTL